MMKRKPCILVAILIGAILSGCGPTQAEFDRTPTQMVVDIFAGQTAQAPKVTSTLTPSPTPMATATVTPTPTRLPTIMATLESTPLLPVVAVDPASQPPPAGYKTYNSPYWLALYYPEDWVQVYDEMPGDILLATESYGIYSGEEAEAAFQIFPAEQGDLGSVLDETLGQFVGSDTEVKVLEKPHSVEVNGQPAVSAMVSLPRNEASVKLEWITVVQGYDRLAVVLAYCPAERQDLYKPILDQMLNSLILRMGPPNPVIGDSTAPPGYVSYTNDWEGFRLSYPPDRTAEMVGDSLFVSPPGEPWQEQYIGRLELIVNDNLDNKLGNPGDQPDEIFYWFITLLGYTSSTFHDAVVVTDVVETEREGQEIARALISGTVDGEPVLAVVTVVQYGRRVGLAIAYGRDLAELTEAGRIMDTLAITNPVRTGGIPLVPGKEYNGTLQNAHKVNFSFSCRAGAPLALILEVPENEADMKLFDATGSAVSYAGSIASPDLKLEEPAVMLLEPQADGVCALSVLDRSNIEAHTFTLKMVDARPGSPALLETIEGELVAGGVDQVEFQAEAGERLILAAHPIGDECVSLSMEIFDEGSQEREERFQSLSDSCEDRAQAYSFVREHDGTYTLHIKGEAGKPVAYRLYILQVD
jgi:hypothetical protein